MVTAMKNKKTLLCALLCIVMILISLSSCGPTSTATVKDANANSEEIFDEVLIKHDGIAYGYAENEKGGYDMMSLNYATGKLIVHGNTDAYVVYFKTMEFGPSIVIDGVAYVTTTCSERDDEDASFAKKGVDLFAFGGTEYLDYGKLFEENVVVESLEEKDGKLVVHIEDASTLFDLE